jgi:hypothetical protein
MLGYLFSSYEVQIRISRNQAQKYNANLLQLTAGFRSLMEIITLLLQKVYSHLLSKSSIRSVLLSVA